MAKFLIHRLYISVLVAVTVSVIAFGLLRLSGDLAAELAGEDATPEEIAIIAKQYGLDRPLHVQYFKWAGDALTGDLGRSLFTNEPVTEMIFDRIGVTVKLAFFSISISVLAFRLVTVCYTINIDFFCRCLESSFISTIQNITKLSWNTILMCFRSTC